MRAKIFLLSAVPLIQHFLITSVFIGLFEAKLAALPELGSHSCQVPMVFIKIPAFKGMCCGVPLVEVGAFLALPASSLSTRRALGTVWQGGSR